MPPGDGNMSLVAAPNAALPEGGEGVAQEVIAPHEAECILPSVPPVVRRPRCPLSQGMSDLFTVVTALPREELGNLCGEAK